MLSKAFVRYAWRFHNSYEKYLLSGLVANHPQKSVDLAVLNTVFYSMPYHRFSVAIVISSFTHYVLFFSFYKRPICYELHNFTVSLM